MTSPSDPIRNAALVTDKLVSIAHAEYHTVLGSKDRSNPMKAALEAAFLALPASPGEPVACPDGWKMVPVEPPPEMLFYMSSIACSDNNRSQKANERAAYDAMLAAAPSFENSAPPKSDD